VTLLGVIVEKRSVDTDRIPFVDGTEPKVVQDFRDMILMMPRDKVLYYFDILAGVGE
jgi:hypothetical protein